MSLSLQDRVAVVAGATRGAGRGIACGLGEAGATVYCTGRSVRGRPATPGRPEVLEETAEMVTERGGRGIHVRVDHTVEAEVAALFARVRKEQGRLDVLVNDVWGGDALTEWGTPFWQLDLGKGFTMLERAVHSHVITSRHGVPLMLEGGSGLVVEITDGDNFLYRGNLFYDLVKVSVIRLAYAMAQELRSRGLTAVALTPGFLRSEMMLEHFGVTEANWRDAADEDRHFAACSETPFFVGRAVAALAADPEVGVKTGQVLSSWNLAKEYGFDDVDGRRPDWGGYLRGVLVAALTAALDAASEGNGGERDRIEKAVRERFDREGVGHLLTSKSESFTDRLHALARDGADEDAVAAFVEREFE